MRSALLLLLLLPAAAGAQAPASGTTMYKCLDAKGNITYSNVTCEKQGLKHNGTVNQDRVTTMPLEPAPMPTQKLKPPVEMPKDLQKTSK